MAPPSQAIDSLVQLGIPKQKAIYALREHNDEIEAAADWAFNEGANWTTADLLQTRPVPTETQINPPVDEMAPSIPFRTRQNFQSSLTTNSISDSTLISDTARSVSSPTRVPARSSLLPGTRVSIVLKQDQPTGKRVQGEVDEVLTKGNHPRGVKVRLRDGRVGRVQALC